MARILILTLVYEPDMVSTASLVGGLARGLQEKGHTITVLTSTPHYNPPEQRGREGGRDSVRVVRVPMMRKGQRRWSRALDYLWFQLAATLLGLWKCGKQDVVLVVSPPITLGLTGLLLARWRGWTFVYNVQELWPDVPIHLGMIRNRFVIRILRGIESRVYRGADASCTIAESFSAALRERGAGAEKVHCIPNFVDTEAIRPGNKENSFAREHGLSESFVVLYAGNIGLTQGLETLVEAAKELRDDSGVKFLIVGQGAAASSLAQALASSKLANTILLPLQPPDRVDDLYATADVCAVLLKRGFAGFTFPSKVLTAMAAGRPVVLSADTDSELAKMIRKAEAGLCVSAESPNELAEAVRQLRADPELCRRLGMNGRRWVEAHCTRPAVVAAYDALFRQLAGDRAGTG